jgi:outer membrane receptor protein involved in Fe transport
MSMKRKSYTNLRKSGLVRRTALTVAVTAALAMTGQVAAQSTTGTIFGTAPVAAGETVLITNNSGISREVAVDGAGQFRAGNMPTGVYTVTLKKDGAIVDSRKGIALAPNAGSSVSFVKPTTEMSAVTVTAGVLPAIDVTSVNSSTVITAKQLLQLPLQQSAEAIALLAPNTAQGAGAYFGNLVSFGGSGVAENSYYVNGFSTGDPFKNLGGFQLPYGAISQQETLSGGYGAKYGRSDGGVINQIGKSGTDQWHFGALYSIAPESWSDSVDNLNYPGVSLPAPYALADPTLQGKLYSYGGKTNSSEEIHSAYVSGPLIKDKLFFFLGVEHKRTHGTSVSNITDGRLREYSNNTTRYYGKINWNIDNNNTFEATVLDQKQTNGTGSTYNFDYNTFQRGAFITRNDKVHNDARFLIAHYTSYISDNATLSVLWGKGTFSNPTQIGNPSTLPRILGGRYQNSAFWAPGTNPNTGIINSQTNTYVGSPDAADGTHGLRVDFTYQLGSHLLGVGIDNMNYSAHDQGRLTSGPNYFWYYRPGGTTVRKYSIFDTTSMTTSQKAFYLQDIWQVAQNVQLNIGVRNEHYINNNDLGQPFVDMKNQWEPRIGASWDVNGDSTFKVYGNLGRYYLALPNSVAKRAANRSTYVETWYSYTGIDPTTGVPTGLAVTRPQYSPDGETGTPKDPGQVAASNLRPQYIDEMIVGFDKQLNEKWVYGAKAMYRKLGSVIDDECSPGQIAAKMTKMGLDPNQYYDSLYGAAYCRLINPGQSNNLSLKKADGTYTTVTMNQADWGYLQKPKRNYTSLDLYLEHPFDGKWYGRVDYTLTNANGNTAGQTRPDFGQADISKTEDWDSWQLMAGANGQLMNSRKHVLRMFGAYQFTPEWLVSATALMQSGVPEECLGYFGAGLTDPTNYGPNYHYCMGKVVHPGYQHTPWTHTLNLGVRYTPNFADKKLAFKVDIYNVFNEQKATQTDPQFAAGSGNTSYSTADHIVSNTFHIPISREMPRYVRFSVSYDY